MSNHIEEILNDIMEQQMNEESQGIVFLKGGFDIMIESYFNSIREIWLLYKKKLSENSKEEVKDIIEKYTVGGIISANGSSHIDIDEISGMIELNPGDIIDPEDFT